MQKDGIDFVGDGNDISYIFEETHDKQVKVRSLGNLCAFEFYIRCFLACSTVLDANDDCFNTY